MKFSLNFLDNNQNINLKLRTAYKLSVHKVVYYRTAEPANLSCEIFNHKHLYKKFFKWQVFQY